MVVYNFSFFVVLAAAIMMYSVDKSEISEYNLAGCIWLSRVVFK